MKAELDKLTCSGIIVESDSNWSSPIIPVVKPEGTVRMCVDYRDLNAITPQVQWFMPSLDDIVEKAGNALILSKLDLAKGFYQIHMDEANSELTTFTCPFSFDSLGCRLG